mgnify:CR=1 FL=1
MKYLKTFEEVYYNSRKEVEGYVDANDLVGQRLWFHTNRTHRNNGWNGMIGIYDTTPSGRKEGYAGRYTNEVRVSEPIFFQTSEAGAKSIKETDNNVSSIHLNNGLSINFLKFFPFTLSLFAFIGNKATILFFINIKFYG